MTRYFLINDADGESYIAWDKPGKPPVPEGCAAPVKVPRLPADYERWDKAGRKFVCDTISKIDAEHLAAHGGNAIAQAHAFKALEARLILAGVPLEGVLSAEAAATGQDLGELAQAVADKASAAREIEINRIVAKRAARNLKSTKRSK